MAVTKEECDAMCKHAHPLVVLGLFSSLLLVYASTHVVPQAESWVALQLVYVEGHKQALVPYLTDCPPVRKARVVSFSKW